MWFCFWINKYHVGDAIMIRSNLNLIVGGEWYLKEQEHVVFHQNWATFQDKREINDAKCRNNQQPSFSQRNDSGKIHISTWWKQVVIGQDEQSWLKGSVLSSVI